MNPKPTVTEEARMMSIKDLAGKSFFIPAYQRGFRWNRQQVKELLDDLCEFASSDAKGVYCLQPIVVRKRKEKEYEVIDGQQRLTALWLLSICYKANPYSQNEINYKLTYEGKQQYSDLIERAINAVENAPDGKKESALENAINDAGDDIDSKNLCNIYEYVAGKKNDADKYKGPNNWKAFQVLNKIFTDGLTNGRDIQIIWDELIVEESVNNPETLEVNAAIIDKFANINANKIALTEAELIKAHLLANVSDIHATAHMWETIERGLNDSQFWFFFARNEKGTKYKTRIDYLFDIWFHSSGPAVEPGEHLISRAAQTKIYDLHGGSVTKSENADELWREVVRIYETLLDWYNDYFLYHTIGLLIEINEGDSAEIIKELCKEYKAEGTSKTAFNKYLLDKISHSYGDILTEINSPDEIVFKDINYSGNKSDVKKLLLLYNVSLLVNAQAKTPQNKYERFPFDYYKNKENPIEVEHINPQNPKGKDYNEEDRKKWACETLKNAKEEMSVSDKVPLIEELYEKIKDVKKLTDSQVEQVEELANVHGFSNLTLLDKNLNIRYSNHSLENKRKHLLAALFGLPIPRDDSPDNSTSTFETKQEEDKFYEKSVIFPGTRWVFLREYADAENCNYWSNKDKEAYETNVRKSIFEYLFAEKIRKGVQPE